MKPTLKNNNSGFTLIELLVVIAILGMMATLVVVNFNRLKVQRSVTLSENEVVTQIRKMQGYALSGHDSPLGSNYSPHYFVMTFVQNSSTYTIGEVNTNLNTGTTLTYNQIESLK